MTRLIALLLSAVDVRFIYWLVIQSHRPHLGVWLWSWTVHAAATDAYILLLVGMALGSIVMQLFLLMNVLQAPRLSGEVLAQGAEDRGFEPRRVLPPNRISSALLRVTDTSAPVRDCAGTQVTTAFTGRAVPGLTGTARPCCACLVRAQCVRAEGPGPNPLQPDGDLPWP
jgi:hypothetical protein